MFSAIEVLAEIGVALLLFTIGLEFSLRRMLEMKRLVLLGGGLQVILTTLLVTGIAYLLGRPVNEAVFFGFLFALSSTAIVLKSYIDRAEIDAPHGRAGVGILLFQDLSIVPMMLMIPILSGREGTSAAKIALTLGIAVAAIGIIIFAARTIVPYLLYHIVRLRSPEVFIISVVLMSLGTSWLTFTVWTVARSRRIHSRHSAFRIRVQPSDCRRHPAFPRRLQQPLFYLHRHAPFIERPGWPMS